MALGRDAIVQAPPPNPNPSREEWREEQDLKAQRGMAQWAGWLLIISVISAGVTAAGVVYVALTLDTSKAAVAAANRNTDEAKRIGEAQVRAYIHPNKIFAVLRPSYEDFSRVTPEFRVRFTNSGNSPALGFIVDLAVFYSYAGASSHVHGNLGQGPVSWAGSDIGPQKTVKAELVDGDSHFRDEDMTALRSTGLTVVVQFWTEFTDVFGEKIRKSFPFEAFFEPEEIGVEKQMEVAWNSIEVCAKMAARGVTPSNHLRDDETDNNGDANA
ncbi:MAG: hypothetical protein RH982_00545 [Parvibaculum sp.]